MAIDINKIRKKLEDLNNESKPSGRGFIWKPQEGKQVVRIVPYQHRRDNPFLEMYFHYEIGKRTILSPVTYGEADPVVEFAEKLRQTGDRDDWSLARKIEPKQRIYVPVIVRGEEEEGVKFWGFGKTVYMELLGIIADPDYGDITDLKTGRDITVEYTPGSKGTYAKTQVRIKPNTTVVTDSRDVLEKIAKEQPDIYDVFKKQSYDEIKEIFENYINGNDSETSEDSESDDSSEKPESTVKSDIADAFDDLF